jgi:hypothetical protein
MENSPIIANTKENTLLDEYLKCYTKYMESLDETISDLSRDIRDVHCPQWFRTQFINSYDILLQKKRDYEDMHNDILKNPEKHKNTIERFIQNYKN